MKVQAPHIALQIWEHKIYIYSLNSFTGPELELANADVLNNIPV